MSAAGFEEVCQCEKCRKLDDSAVLAARKLVPVSPPTSLDGHITRLSEQLKTTTILLEDAVAQLGSQRVQIHRERRDYEAEINRRVMECDQLRAAIQERPDPLTWDRIAKERLVMLVRVEDLTRKVDELNATLGNIESNRMWMGRRVLDGAWSRLQRKYYNTAPVTIESHPEFYAALMGTYRIPEFPNLPTLLVVGASGA